MKTTIELLVVRNKITNEVIDVQGIKDMYDEVSVEYTSDLVTEQDILNWGNKIYSNSYACTYIPDLITKLKTDDLFYIQVEAKDIPSLGNILVNIEKKEIELL
jgi:hypothetical protein